jgi:hypothetical protein
MESKSTIISSFAMLMLIISITGCAVVMPTIRAEYPQETSISDITAAAALALQNHEFSIATVNDNIGVVTTNWKDVKPTSQKVFEAFSSRRSSWRMMITVAIDKQTKQINIKPIKQINSGYGSWDNAKLGADEKNMLTEILKEILTAINAEAAPITWEPPEQAPKPAKPEPVETFSEDGF